MTLRKKIIFRVDANKKIGWGHFYRCFALAEMLKDNFQISFAVSEPPNDLARIVESKSFNLISLPLQDYTSPDKREDGELNFDLTGLLDEIHIVILDGYWFGNKYLSELRHFPVRVVLIEDSGEGEYDVDLIINHAPGVQKENYLLHSEKPRFALGPKYVLLRPAFLKSARVASLRPSTKEVMVCFGGSDYLNLTLKVVQELLRGIFFKKIKVVTGPAYQHQDLLHSLCQKTPGIEIFSSLEQDEMLHIMETSEVSIVPASGLLYEVLAAGCKPLTCWYAEHQKGFHDRFVERGYALTFGDNRSGFRADCLSENLERLMLEDELRQEELRNEMAGAADNMKYIFNELFL